MCLAQQDRLHGTETLCQQPGLGMRLRSTLYDMQAEQLVIQSTYKRYVVTT